MGTFIDTQDDVTVEEMSREDGRAMFNRLSCDNLGITVDEFLRRLDAGDYEETTDEQVVRLMMLVPFAR